MSDYEPELYQDGGDTGEETIDPLMHELNDTPNDILGLTEYETEAFSDELSMRAPEEDRENDLTGEGSHG